MNKKEIAIVILAVIAVSIFVALIESINDAQAFQTVITAALFFITAIYVNRTADIARATEKQAEASVKMAKQMIKPMLIPYFKFTSDFDESRNVQFEAGVNNDGNGPAYDIESWIEDPPAKFIYAPKISVLRGHYDTLFSSPDARITFPKSESLLRRFLVVKYKDVDGSCEIRLPFVMTTKENNKPIALQEPPSRKILKKYNLEDELP